MASYDNLDTKATKDLIVTLSSRLVTGRKVALTGGSRKHETTTYSLSEKKLLMMSIAHLHPTNWPNTYIPEEDFIAFFEIEKSKDPRNRIEKIALQLRNKGFLTPRDDGLEENKGKKGNKAIGIYDEVEPMIEKKLVRLKFSDSLKPFITHIMSGTTFSKFHLYLLSNCKSEYGVQLLWVLTRIANIPKKTKTLQFALSLELYEEFKRSRFVGQTLIAPTELDYDATGSYSRFNQLKSRVIAPAIEDVNKSQSIISIDVSTFKEIHAPQTGRGRRKVIGFKFDFTTHARITETPPERLIEQRKNFVFSVDEDHKYAGFELIDNHDVMTKRLNLTEKEFNQIADYFEEQYGKYSLEALDSAFSDTYGMVLKEYLKCEKELRTWTKWSVTKWIKGFERFLEDESNRVEQSLVEPRNLDLFHVEGEVVQENEQENGDAAIEVN